ncbi:MAG: DUF2147 domain-containing protein [Syntrophaceae bacterium]|jgi:uncharacterized protein (DUF2147 family)|nr:DUF2147 domain-containing protein [Syntrophaceae bacterium]
MKKALIFGIAIFMVVAFSGIAPAEDPSIVGIWSMPALKGKDKGKERAQVEIFAKDGVYYGKIVRLSLLPANALCRGCKDEKQNKPLLGMQILENLKKEAGRYVEGKICDFDEGKEYKCMLTQITPDKLMVTASWFGFKESHYWTRIK